MGGTVHHVGSHGLARQLVGCFQTQFTVLQHHRLAQGNGRAWFLDDGLHQFFHLGIELRRRHHAVHQALRQSRGSVDKVPRQQHFHSALGGHVAHQRHAGRGTEQAVVDAAGGKAGALFGHGQVALRYQLAARRRGHALHTGNHRHGQLVNGQHHPAAAGKQLLVISQFRVLGHFLEVVPRAKRPALRRQHHGTGVLVSSHGV